MEESASDLEACGNVSAVFFVLCMFLRDDEGDAAADDDDFNFEPTLPLSKFDLPE